MTQISAVTNADFFGEPIYLGEVCKELAAAAIGMQHTDFEFIHSKDDASKVSVVITIDTVGDESVAEELEKALAKALNPRISYKVIFIKVIDIGFESTERIQSAVKSVTSDAEGMVLQAHVRDPHAELADDYAQLDEDMRRVMSRRLRG